MIERAEQYRIGQWCYAHDAECPYRDEMDVREWTRGYIDAERSAESAKAGREPIFAPQIPDW